MRRIEGRSSNMCTSGLTQIVFAGHSNTVFSLPSWAIHAVLDMNRTGRSSVTKYCIVANSNRTAYFACTHHIAGNRQMWAFFPDSLLITPEPKRSHRWSQCGNTNILQTDKCPSCNGTGSACWLDGCNTIIIQHI